MLRRLRSFCAAALPPGIETLEQFQAGGRAQDKDCDMERIEGTIDSRTKSGIPFTVPALVLSGLECLGQYVTRNAKNMFKPHTFQRHRTREKSFESTLTRVHYNIQTTKIHKQRIGLVLEVFL
jgi:hypothetical protein